MALRVGFIGAGLMGSGMAKNIVTKGFPLRILGHRRREAVDRLIGLGAHEAASAAELARESDIVVLCLPSSAEVEAVVLGEAGLREGAHRGLIVVDSTTAEPASTERVAAALAERGARFADAPLTRSPVDAEAGRLNTLVGGDDGVLAAIRPVLETFSENIFHIGPLGSAHKMKLINNFMTQGMAALVAEACLTATRAGVDLEKLFEVGSAGAANSSIFQRMMPWVLGHGEGGMLFQLKNARKDLRYYTHLAEAAGVASFLGQAVHQTFVLAAAQGESESWVPALARGLAKAQGVELGPDT